jgi:hypothetical protein
MSQDFDLHTESDIDDFDFDFDEYYPEEAWEALEDVKRKAEELHKAKTDATPMNFEHLTNDQFLSAIFGNSFTSAHPLVCKKAGDPSLGGWAPSKWPCNTDHPGLNWYTLPSLYLPDETGRYRAKKEFAVSVHAVMVDDVGTKVSAEHFATCPPSWAVETSPGNCQYGYILIEPITDLERADELKEKLIQAELCDSGATGGTARWMRMPVAINGRPKYGAPSPRCRLVQWRPELKYSVADLYSALRLSQHKATLANQSATPTLYTPIAQTQLSEDAGLVIEALKTNGLYKSALGSGKHDITCPWVQGHSDSIDSGTVYFEPNQKYPTGGFKCHHSHGHLFHIRELKEFLGLGTGAVEVTQLGHPQKLPPALRPVPALDENHLPDAIKDAVIDLADRLQCPPDYLAVAMLSAAGSVVGNTVGIFPYSNDESWEVYPALWGGIVGDPGSKKTPSLLHAHKPLQHLEELASQRYAQDMLIYEQAKAQFEQALKTWNSTKGSGLKPPAPVEPKRERYVVHDSTYQALGVILADNPRGVLALADELSGLLQSLDTAGQEAARGFYLTGWSGTGGYSFDRVGRGSIRLDRYCLSVFGGFQPDRVKAYVHLSQRGSSKNDGLLQRFQLLVWPDPVGNFKLVDRVPKQQAITKYLQAVLNLPKLGQQSLLGTRQLANGSQLLHFSDNAQQAFNTWYVKNENMLANGHLDPARQSHFAKYRSLIPALALLFHLLDGHTGPVCEDCLNRAVAFAKYLKKHADRIYASISGHDHAAVRMLAERLLDAQLADGFTCRTLTLKGWAGLATKEQAQAAIDALVEYNWLIETEIRSGGRPTVKYALNPNASSDLL